jgi:hypothetical protein
VASDGGHGAEMLIECADCDLPKLFATTTTMAQAEISYTLTFVPAAGGGGGQARNRATAAAAGCYGRWAGTGWMRVVRPTSATVRR